MANCRSPRLATSLVLAGRRTCRPILLGNCHFFHPFRRLERGGGGRAQGTAPFEVTDPGQQVLFVCTQVQLHSRLMCERPQYWGKAVRSLPFHVWVGGSTPLAQSEVNICLCLSCRCGSEVHVYCTSLASKNINIFFRPAGPSYNWYLFISLHA